MINESFNKVGINEFSNNSMALMDAQELTNESAEIFYTTG